MSEAGHTERLEAALDGKYRIERQLGEGGMATVYLADDLRHERKVAVKVLKPELAAVVGADRFLAEIKTTANLQHPLILPLFDSGEADSFPFYVMPYVEGESLRDKLDREKQLSVDEAVRIAASIAEALDYAHRQGVVHRDVKPANILLQDGTPVVSDFGIALAVSASGADRLTETGLSLGTPHYMSPEQATGEESVGAATDIYALACVLYEMLVGTPPFVGRTPQAILAKILSGRPEPVSLTREAVPPHVDAAIAKALEKVPADRFKTARDLGAALTDGMSVPARETVEAGAPGARGSGAFVGLGLIAAALVGAFAWVAFSGPDQAAESGAVVPQRYSIQLPDSATYAAFGDLAVSRDGQQLVYTGLSGDRLELHVRPLGALETRPIAISTDSIVYAPFLSPDGEWVAFFTPRPTAYLSTAWSLKRVPVGGGRAETLADVARPNGAWTDDGYLVFTGSDEGFDEPGLFRMPENGGEPERLTSAELGQGESMHHTPFALPGGRGIVFRIERANAPPQTAILETATGEYRALEDVGSGYPVQYIPTGHLIYPEAGTLMAIGFDLDRLTTVGRPFAVVEGLQTLESGDDSYASFTLSADGLLIYAPGEPVTPSRDPVYPTLMWVSRDGVEEPLPVEPDRYGFPRISPNGERVAAIIYGGTERSDIWLFDVDTGARLRLTDGGYNRSLMWSPDGQDILFSSTVDTSRPVEYGLNSWFGNMWRVAVDGRSPPERLVTSEQNQTITGLAPDGTVLYTFLSESNTRSEIWTLSPESGSIRPHLTGAPQYTNGTVSPDGRWLAYRSDVSGAFEIYVQAYPEGGMTSAISVGGGTWVHWSPDGRELFFRNGDAMVAAPFDTSTGTGGAPSILFRGAFAQPNTGRYFDVAPDGRFLMIGLPQQRIAELEAEALEPPTAESLVAVIGFFEEVRTRAGGGG